MHVHDYVSGNVHDVYGHVYAHGYDHVNVHVYVNHEHDDAHDPHDAHENELPVFELKHGLQDLHNHKCRTEERDLYLFKYKRFNALTILFTSY